MKDTKDYFRYLPKKYNHLDPEAKTALIGLLIKIAQINIDWAREKPLPSNQEN